MKSVQISCPIYSFNLRIQPEYGKTQTKKIPYSDTFHAVIYKFCHFPIMVCNKSCLILLKMLKILSIAFDV